IWTDTDPDRCGTLPFAFEPGMGFERYVDYMLDMPMYFVYRDGRYIDAAGQSFRDFMAGKLPALPGQVPGMGDWADHLTTAFPEVRLKKFIEMRAADGGPWPRLCALPALWVVLLDARAADALDPASIAAIYNEGIVDRVATCESEPRTPDQIAAWLGGRYPVVVVETEGRIVAWAACSSYRSRACYAGVAEFSVYVARA